MSIQTQNVTNTLFKYQTGAVAIGSNNFLPFNPTTQIKVGPRPQFTLFPTQVMGLVPIFFCTEDCREGLYKADDYPDDTQMVLPVFAQSILGAADYTDDYNTFVFNYAMTVNGPVNDFYLQQLQGKNWVTVANLNNSTYGNYLNYKCANVNYQGFQILWSNVMNLLGEGQYRFYINGKYSNLELGSYCGYSPPFCLAAYTCSVTNGTVKFTTTNTGGTRGSVTQQGVNWSLCCQPSNGNCLNIPLTVTGDTYGSRINITFTDPSGKNYTNSISNGSHSETATQIVANLVTAFNALGIAGATASQNTNGILTVCINQNLIGSKLNLTIFNVSGTITTPFGNPVNLNFPSNTNSTGLSWNDSIRVPGFFGFQTNDFQRDFIKYQTGQINKVRDEMLKKFKLYLGALPQWFYDAFSAYALQADYLYANDYNLNNANYNIKNFYIVADSNIEPEHRFESRYARVNGTCLFKEGIQSVFADRCC